ncbi:SGNH/GDSL hydrolase family protein [Rhizobium sp. CSW-27]|uniref:SGNH/GDSL hydrolase family protein n=1 Tax=Rhizobium sp. CSW-27 TaxID=2839985 RepID=UPI001C031DE6|nr:SGNH/GDSL hydrolase family protein [Rhizobium sp. CSW-27]MBT9373221.1 SGNH/GDSL hydrolase family protein [Rhizobium sp. CSW-27]
MGELIPNLNNRYLQRGRARAPTINDDSTKGYAVGDHWQAGGTVWEAQSVASGGAIWKQVIGAGARPYEILGASVVAGIGGLAQMRRGYTGAACDISATIGGSTVTATINILSNGQFDEATLGTYYNMRDAGTHIVCTKLYNQDASGNDFVQSGSLGMAKICWDEVLRRFVLTRTFGLSNTIETLVLSGGASFTSSDCAAVVFGRCAGSSMDAGTGVPFAFGSWGTAYYAVGTRPLQTGTLYGGLQTTGSTGSQKPFSPRIAFDAAPMVMAFRSYGTTETLHVNNEISTTTGYRPLYTLTGAYINGPDNATFGNPLHAVGYILCKAAPTVAQISLVKAALYAMIDARPQSRDLVMMIADSRGAGSGGTYHSLPAWLTKHMANPARVISMTQGGSTSTQHLAAAPTLSVDMYSATRQNVVVIGPLGTNDYATLTPAQTYANLQAIAAIYRAAGWKVVALAEMSSTNANHNTHQAAVRDLILGGDQTWFDRLVNVATIPAVMLPGNTSYYADGLHETDLLQDAMASMIAAAADELLAA